MRRASLICIFPVLLSACGQEVLVFDGARYGQDDPIIGLLPGDPAGDRIDFVDSSGSSCSPQLVFFPDVLTDDQTIGLFIPQGCSIILRTDDHRSLSSQNVTYRISWLGSGNGVVTPIVADATNNADASIEFEGHLIHYRASDPTPTPGAEDLADINSPSHRVSISLPRQLGKYEARVDGFEDGEVAAAFNAAEFRMSSPDVLRPYLTGIRIDAGSGLGPIRDGYIISDMQITHDRN